LCKNNYYYALTSESVPNPPPNIPVPLVVLPTPAPTALNQVFVVTQPLSKLFTDDTDRFPLRAQSGNQFVMIVGGV